MENFEVKKTCKCGSNSVLKKEKYKKEARKTKNKIIQKIMVYSLKAYKNWHIYFF